MVLIIGGIRTSGERKSQMGQRIMSVEIVAGWTNELLDQFGRMTVRQIYYQLVSQRLIPNKASAYGSFDNHLTRARETGLVDPSSIIDRSRTIRNESRPGWESPDSYLATVQDAYRRDPLHGQPRQVELWVEKDALSQVLYDAVERYQPTVVVCRGYSPYTLLYEANERLDCDDLVLYAGDFDPSGLDAYRDIADKLRCEVHRIALTEEQIEAHQLPPIPTKATDKRQPAYVQQYGDAAWELDALRPDTFQAAVREAFEAELDLPKIADVRQREEEEQAELHNLIARLRDDRKR